MSLSLNRAAQCLRPLFLALCATLILLGDSAPLPAADLSVLAQLTQIEGKVEVRKAGASGWSPAETAMELGAGDAVRTAAQATATLRRPDGTLLSLYPYSELTVEDERSVLLALGRLWSHFTKSLGVARQIRTPTSVALIRGTVLGVSAAPEGDSQVVVFEGLVEVQDRVGESRSEVAAGFAVRATAEGRLGALERAGERDLEEGRRFKERMERGELRGQDRPGRSEAAREKGRPERDRAEGRGRERGDRQDRVRGAEGRLERALERGHEIPVERLERLLDRTRGEAVQRRAEDARERQRIERGAERPQGGGRLPADLPDLPRLGDLPVKADRPEERRP